MCHLILCKPTLRIPHTGVGVTIYWNQASVVCCLFCERSHDTCVDADEAKIVVTP